MAIETNVKLGVFAFAVFAIAAIPQASRAQIPCPKVTLPAYAHNDYENKRPLLDALSLGFRGVEADLFLVDGVLRVGHDRNAARHGASLEASLQRPLLRFQ